LTPPYASPNIPASGNSVLPKAKAAAQRALELDDTVAEAHAALAYAELFDWDWLNGEREFKRAIELNPNNAFLGGAMVNFCKRERGSAKP